MPRVTSRCRCCLPSCWLLKGVRASTTLRGSLRCRQRDGRINTTGYSLGHTLTCYGENGFYVDGKAQATYLDSSLKSNLMTQSVACWVSGYGYAISVPERTG